VVNRAVIVGMLEAYECRTSEASNGQEAVSRALEGAFDLVFMDCQMPVLDGFEATAEIRRFEISQGRRRVPIVALTASALKGERERCLAAGMDDYLSKPVRQSELGQAISRWVGEPTAAGANGNGTGKGKGSNGNGAGHGQASVSAKQRATAAVLDHSVIDAIRAMPSQRSGDTLGRLIGIYLQHTPSAIQQLRVAVDAGHCPEAQRIAHTIKSSSGMLGATGLAELLAEAEAAGRASSHSDLTRLVAIIESEYQAVHEALSQLLPSGAHA
jgi:CheY-like chemotaxis protein